MDATNSLSPHVLIFPLPAQGHINSMLNLAELLSLSTIHVTFLLSPHDHSRLLQHTNILQRLAPYPNFKFQTISDGVPLESSRSGTTFVRELIQGLRTVVGPLFRELVVELNRDRTRPVTCIIADGTLGFAIDVAEELGIPIFYFRTISACSFWAYHCLPKLIEAGELPFKGNDMDVAIKSIPGMETFLRRRDLPGICRANDLSTLEIEFIISESKQTPRTRGLILNTFEDLEGPIISHVRTKIPNLYTIGPLHAHVKTRLSTPVSTSSSSLWEEDGSSMTWLDSQSPKSVIYVSFGSIAILTRDQLMEFWHGLIDSGKRFLWVIRPELVPDVNQGQIPAEVLNATEERGKLVCWVPQEEVLTHKAVGGFLTHSGWNSTLESIVAGVPMLCWPYFVDQQMNSRYVGEVWKIGLDMKDIGDRFTVAKMVRDLMDSIRDDFVQSVDCMADLARKAINQGGSSYCNLERLIHDIRLMSAE